MRRVLALLAALPACSGSTSGTAPGDEGGRVLRLTLGAEEAAAGQAVPYQVKLLEADGTEVGGAMRVELESDAGGFSHDRATLTIAEAGEHEVRATADKDGESYRAAATLRVRPGPAATLDLRTAAPTVVAGAALGFALEIRDRHGNAVDPAAADATVVARPDGPVVELDARTVTSEATGVFRLTARVPRGNLVDGEVFEVVAGEPTSIEVEVELPVEVGDTVTPRVTVRDALGNPTGDDVEAAVVPADGAQDLGGSFLFVAEGWYQVRAAVADRPEIAATFGPFLVDSTGPVIEVETPARAAMLDDPVVPVRGRVYDDASGVASLTVAGEEVEVAADGSFSAALDARLGMNLLRIEAADGDGNRSLVVQSFLFAPSYVPPEGLVGDGLAGRLNRQALGLIADLVEETLTPDALGAIPDPAYSAEDRDCWDPCFWGSCEICVTWYRLNFRVHSLSFADPEVTLDPGAGYLDLTATVHGVAVPWSADGVLLEVGYSASGTITADSLTVRGRLWPSVTPDGEVRIAMTDAQVTTSGFHFDLDGWLWDVAGVFGLSLDGLIAGVVEGALRGVVEDAVPDLVAGVFQDLDVSATLEVDGLEFFLEAFLTHIEPDPDGVTLRMETDFAGPVLDAIDPGRGSMVGGYRLPDYGAEPGVEVSVGIDFVNQVLYALWHAGILHRTFTAQGLGVSADSVAAVMPGLGEVAMAITPLLPPQAVPGEAAWLALGVGDILVDVYPDEAAGEPYLSASVSLEADADASLAGGRIALSVADVRAHTDILVNRSPYPESMLAPLLDVLVPLTLPDLLDGFTDIPMPSLSGFAILDPTISPDGPESAFLTLGGDLARE